MFKKFFFLFAGSKNSSRNTGFSQSQKADRKTPILGPFPKSIIQLCFQTIIFFI